jgi:hypothetical protein
MENDMTRKENAAAYHKLAADRAKVAAKYAKSKDYDLAARWYNAADVFTRIAREIENGRL